MPAVKGRPVISGRCRLLSPILLAPRSCECDLIRVELQEISCFPLPVPIGYVKEVIMKTLGEFIQRLQVDAAFEKQAQAFDNGDELMAFVRGEGYDFTLDQLTDEFQREAQLRAEAGDEAPAPKDESASSPPGPEDPEISTQPEVSPNRAENAALGEGENRDSAPGPPEQKAQEPPTALPPPGPTPAGLFRGGGGRHRGFSPERLKSGAVEES
jgi:predicted ribosomally synthesized peptide with nif11-like leader